MPIEKSAGAIIFRRKSQSKKNLQQEDNKIYYLLLHYPGASKIREKDYWDFPKGHIEKGEKIEQTIKREIKEETGIESIKFIEGFKETIRYFFRFKGKKILKFVTFYLAETDDEQIKISKEHIGYQWLSFEEAVNKLGFENAKKILKKANNYLNFKIKNKNEKNGKKGLMFRDKVYKIIKKIPSGKVLTYKKVAQLAGYPFAWRAVGNILSKNRNSKIPCHRVIKSNGKIGDYNRGAKKKVILLKKEGLIIKNNKIR